MEINPILQKWQSINDTRCLECARVIPVNMARHLRLDHTTCQCFWRCPVACCPRWFASEFDGKDHLEEIHLFAEGHGCSYYECLHQFGLEWFSRRSFFDQRNTSGQALWMDIALARKSGQELHNDYVTANPAFDNLRFFFRAAVRELIHAYLDYPRPRIVTTVASEVDDLIRRVTEDDPQSSSHTPPEDPVEETPLADSLLATLRLSPTTPTVSVVTTTAKSQTPGDQPTDLNTGSAEHAHLHIPLSRGGGGGSLQCVTGR